MWKPDSGRSICQVAPPSTWLNVESVREGVVDIRVRLSVNFPTMDALSSQLLFSGTTSNV